MSKVYFIKERKTPDELKKITQNTECAVTNALLEELYKVPGFFKKGVAFVGKYTLKNHDVIYSCPKHMDDDIIKNAAQGAEEERKEIKKHIELILNVLLKLEKEDSDNFGECVFSPSEREKKKYFIDQLSLSEFILKDYLNHGLYYEEQHFSGKQPQGRISWNSTVKKNIPFISHDNIVYLDLIRDYHNKDYSNLISLIHASVIHYAYEYLENFGRKQNIHFPDVTPISMEELHKQELIRIIRKHMLTAYSNREIFLLRALEAWCDKSIHYHRFVFGTTAFDRIWEAVNDFVWGNDDQKDSGNPVYTFYNSEDDDKNCYAGGESRIDTMHIVRDKAVAIFDSKYYVPREEICSLQQTDISGYPSNADISKQVGYLRLKKEQYGDIPNIRYSNAFLLPKISEKLLDKLKLPQQNWQDKLYHISGYATRGTYDENKNIRDTSPVLMIHVDPESLYKNFLHNDPIGDTEIEEIVIAYNDAEKSIADNNNKCYKK